MVQGMCILVLVQSVRGLYGTRGVYSSVSAISQGVYMVQGVCILVLVRSVRGFIRYKGCVF